MLFSRMSAIPRQQLSRTALLYLLAAFVVCVLLLSVFLPKWLLLVAGFCVGWRLLVFTGRLSFPSVWIKSALVFLAGIALFFQYGFSVSLDVFVMLLLLGFSLKLLELHHIREARLLLYLAFFVLMNVFLFDQNPVYTLLVFSACVIVLAALVAVHSDDAVMLLAPWQPIKKGAVIFSLALPVMLFMFLVMPRLPPLWSMPLQKQQQGKTGMSDSMSPGDVAQLARSADLAFRASFTDGIPDKNTLYWSGLILEHFDGVRWTEDCRDCQKNWFRSSTWFEKNAREKTAWDKTAGAKKYQVIIEANGNKWLYVLQPSRINNDQVWMNEDGMFRNAKNIDQRQMYYALYVPVVVDAAPGLKNRNRYLALVGNPQAIALAQQWRRDSRDDQAVIQKALAFYHDDFTYTLQPPVLGEQRVDDFLFNSRRGFCEHFAGSFVFLMRAAGIPARVVLGYMGGEINTSATNAGEGYVTVRQYDAHAWAEVWLPGQGWQRVDPTAAVAPERIELGFADAYGANDAFAIDAGLAALHRFAFLNALRLQFDQLDYLWARWVLGYEGEQQQDILRRLGWLSPWRAAAWGGGGVVLVFLLLCAFLYWREEWSSQESPTTRRYRRLCRAYARCGVERLPGQTPLQYAETICLARLPGANDFLALSQQYYDWLYVYAAPQQFTAQARRLYWRVLWWVFKDRYFRLSERSEKN